MDHFEHANLGPLPHNPILYKLKEEVEAWKRKYTQLFDETCKTTSIENQLRERLRVAEADCAKYKAKCEALMELLKEVMKK